MGQKRVKKCQKKGQKLPFSPGFGQETPNPSGDSNTKTSGSYRFGGGGVQNHDFGVFLPPLPVFGSL